MMPGDNIFPFEKWDFSNDSILAALPAEDLRRLMENKTEKFYKRGETIYREGAYPAGVFFVISGKVKKYKLDMQGREQIIQVINSGDLMGYHAVLSESRYPVSSTALEESMIAFVAKEDFLRTVQQSPALNKQLLRTLSTEFAVFSNCLTLFARNSVRERLALRLVILHETYKEGVAANRPVYIDMSREDLASLVGSARENLLREMMLLKEEGIVTTQGRKIMVNDIEKLIAIAGYR